MAKSEKTPKWAKELIERVERIEKKTLPTKPQKEEYGTYVIIKRNKNRKEGFAHVFICKGAILNYDKYGEEINEEDRDCAVWKSVKSEGEVWELLRFNRLTSWASRRHAVDALEMIDNSPFHFNGIDFFPNDDEYSSEILELDE